MPKGNGKHKGRTCLRSIPLCLPSPSTSQLHYRPKRFKIVSRNPAAVPSTAKNLRKLLIGSMTAQPPFEIDGYIHLHLLRLVVLGRFVAVIERCVPASERFFRQVPSLLRVLGSFPLLTYGPWRGPARRSVVIRFSSLLICSSTATTTSLLKERLFPSAIRFRLAAT